MLSTTSTAKATLERTTERLRRTARSLRLNGSLSHRRKLAAAFPKRRELEGLFNHDLGFGRLPNGTIRNLGPAIELSQRLHEERHTANLHKKKRDYNPMLCEPKKYEDAPAFFDLALSDDVLQVASDYLGGIPILTSIKLWWTPVNSELKGSQLYHRDGHMWFVRRVKFMFNMNDIDDGTGPFTFLPADISERVSMELGTMDEQNRVSDEEMYKLTPESNAVRLIGPAGTGCAVDSSRCYHFGGRARKKERLLLMLNFMGLVDAAHGGFIVRTPAFESRFRGSPVANLVIPNTA